MSEISGLDFESGSEGMALTNQVAAQQEVLDADGNMRRGPAVVSTANSDQSTAAVLNRRQNRQRLFDALKISAGFGDTG